MKKMCRDWGVDTGARHAPPGLAGVQAVHIAGGVVAIRSRGWRSPGGTMSRRDPMLAALLLAIAATPCAAGACKVESGAQVLPLVEIYTAEGCNECPPADRWFSALSRTTSPTQAALLAFHVDYWDEFGWPDRFADHAYSQRQDLRITLAKKKVTYTPQVMIGSDVRVKWRAAARLPSPLERVRARPAAGELALDVSRAGAAPPVGVAAARAPGA